MLVFFSKRLESSFVVYALVRVFEQFSFHYLDIHLFHVKLWLFNCIVCLWQMRFSACSACGILFFLSSLSPGVKHDAVILLLFYALLIDNIDYACVAKQWSDVFYTISSFPISLAYGLKHSLIS